MFAITALHTIKPEQIPSGADAHSACKYTAYQGFNALFHNTEVMMSKGVNLARRDAGALGH